MTQDCKELLFKDLSARLPYGVRIKRETITGSYAKIEFTLSLETFNHLKIGIQEDRYSIRPYLRLMSSMTEEEKEEYWNIINLKSPEMPVGEIPSIETIAQCSVIVLDWLLSKGFDIRGLIPMGLALEAPEGMYKF